MQELGETRQEMTRGLLKKIHKIVEERKDLPKKYYILVHAKPTYPGSHEIKQLLVVTNQRPRMMLATLLFGVDREKGVLTLEWALPGDWPTYEVDTSKAEPVPEVISSIQKVGESNYVYG